MTIREATADDLPRLVELGEQMHRESAWRGVAFSDAKTRRAFSDGALRRNGFRLLLYEHSGSVEGFLLGAVAAPLFSEELISFDLLMYVTPLRRGGFGAHRLWRAFRDEARASGAVELRLGVSSGVTVERSHRFYTRLGMEMVGSNYRLGLRP